MYLNFCTWQRKVGAPIIMPDLKDDQQLAYTVQKQNDRFEICVASGRVIMVCADENSASQYATLMNEAHRAGYKLGYRDGRNK